MPRGHPLHPCRRGAISPGSEQVGAFDCELRKTTALFGVLVIVLVGAAAQDCPDVAGAHGPRVDQVAEPRRRLPEAVGCHGLAQQPDPVLGRVLRYHGAGNGQPGREAAAHEVVDGARVLALHQDVKLEAALLKLAAELGGEDGLQHLGQREVVGREALEAPFVFW